MSKNIFYTLSKSPEYLFCAPDFYLFLDNKPLSCSEVREVLFLFLLIFPRVCCLSGGIGMFIDVYFPSVKGISACVLSSGFLGDSSKKGKKFLCSSNCSQRREE